MNVPGLYFRRRPCGSDETRILCDPSRNGLSWEFGCPENPQGTEGLKERWEVRPIGPWTRMLFITSAVRFNRCSSLS